MSAEPADQPHHDALVHARLRAWCARTIPCHDEMVRRCSQRACLPCPAQPSCTQLCGHTQAHLYLQLGWSDLLAETVYVVRLLRGMDGFVSSLAIQGSSADRVIVDDLVTQTRDLVTQTRVTPTPAVRITTVTHDVCWIRLCVWLRAGHAPADAKLYNETIYVNTAMERNLTAKDIIDGLTSRTHRHNTRGARGSRYELDELAALHSFRTGPGGESCYLDRDGSASARTHAGANQTV